MSVSVMGKVWEVFPRGGADLLAILALADWADDAGVCYPSVAAVAKKTRVSRSSAQRTLHRLIDEGFVRVMENHNGGAPGSTRRYRVIPGGLTGSAGATGSSNATGSVGASDGPRFCTKRGSTGATQTIIEPSLTIRSREMASKSGQARNDRFDEFWQAYPRKVAKQSALKSWQKLKPSADTLVAMLDALQAAKRSEQWSRDGGQFIPHPATWLNGKRWEDEHAKPTRNPLRVAI